jgi:hypothetical protein
MSELTLEAELERLVAQPVRERPATPFPEPGYEPPAEASDAFDAQILAALVSP